MFKRFNLILKVEFLPGTHIETAIKEAKKLAQKLCCGVTFCFNGVDLRVWPNSDIKEKVKE